MYQKLIAIPYGRYTNLVEKEKAKSGLKQTINATMKNLENQELLQRQRYYDEVDEEMPENHKKVMNQTAITALPPPPLKNIREYKERQKPMIIPIKKSFKPRKPAVRKPVTKKTPATVPQAQKITTFFNILDPNSFSNLSKKTT